MYFIKELHTCLSDRCTPQVPALHRLPLLRPDGMVQLCHGSVNGKKGSLLSKARHWETVLVIVLFTSLKNTTLRNCIGQYSGQDKFNFHRLMHASLMLFFLTALLRPHTASSLACDLVIEHQPPLATSPCKKISQCLGPGLISVVLQVIYQLKYLWRNRVPHCRLTYQILGQASADQSPFWHLHHMWYLNVRTKHNIYNHNGKNLEEGGRKAWKWGLLCKMRTK